MTLDPLREALPPYARDLGQNLSSLIAETVLSEQQKWGCFVAAAHAVGVPAALKPIEASAAEAGLSEVAKTAAKTAAGRMAMNNIYFRALHLMRNAEYRALPAKLRVDVLANPGVDKADFELWALTVSAINGCGACLDSHEAELKKHGVSALAVQAALRIAAVVHAVSRVLAGEAAAA